MRRAYDLLAEGFGPGSNGPLFITVEGDAANDQAAVGQFAQTIADTDGVRTAFPAGPPLADGLVARDRLPGQRPAGRRDHRRSSRRSATT